MTDPTRWSEAGASASSIEQMLMHAGQNQPMPPDEKRAIWKGVLTGIATGAGVVSNTQPGAPAVSLTKAAAVASPAALLALKGAKAVCVLAALVGLGAGGYHWLGKSPSRTQVVPTRSPPAAGVLPAPLVTAHAPAESPQLESSSSTPPTLHAPAPSRASQLKEESQAVMAARQALRSNEPARALQLLAQAQQRFKRGALTEEREALTIEALAKAGQSARASARAEAFLAHHPRSPHAADVQRFVAH